MQRREEARAVHQQALDAGDFALAQKMALRSFLPPEMVIETKQLLDLLGVPWVDAKAKLKDRHSNGVLGQLDVATQDWDALLYGTPVLIRNMMTAGNKSHGRVVKAQKIILDDLLSEHELTREQLIDLAIMIGTDFHPGIKGIGPKTGIKLIKQFGDIETICEEKGKEVPESWTKSAKSSTTIRQTKCQMRNYKWDKST